MPFRAVRRISWAPFTWVAVPAWATCRVAASTWWTRSRSSTRSWSTSSTASSQGAGAVSAIVRSAPGVGQREDPPSRFRRGRLDQALVLELLQRGIDRAGARRPVPAAALGDHLDDLVAVHRLLREERQDGGADVAPAGAATGAEKRCAEPTRAVHAPPASAPVLSASAAAGRSADMNQRLTLVSDGSEALGDRDCSCCSHRLSFLHVAITIYRNASLVKDDDRPAG